MSNKSYEVKYSTMSDEMQRDALQCVLTTEYLCKEYNDIAKYIAKEFDRKHQPDWFCIVGNFGCYHPSKYNVCFCCHDSILTYRPPPGRRVLAP
uniref:Dynein light chain n=1 Tax=Sinocyclocheilus rhinocerous TaxID=307959 RepID=A0A673IXH0_9TELE